MYQAYDRHLWERIPEPPAPEAIPLDASRLDCRVVVHPLLMCPPLPRHTRYLLVRRRLGGQRDILGEGRARSPHPTLNLADVRQQGARLGAGEVYVLPA